MHWLKKPPSPMKMRVKGLRLLLVADSAKEIIYTRNTTESINLLALQPGQVHLKAR